MKKILVIFGIVLFVFVIYRLTSNSPTLPAGGQPQSLWEGYETMAMTINGIEYTLVVADTPARHAEGLMHVRKPVPFDGMVFMFPDAQMRSFWNKNTFEDLTIYWMNDGEVMGKSELPSIEKSGEYIINSPLPVDMVVEIIE